MNRLNKEQKVKVTQFLSITGASEKVAIDCLKKVNWGVEPGIDYFFAAGLASAPGNAVNMQQIEAMFAKYKDKEGTDIQAEGLVAVCEDLGVDPSDVIMLVVSYHCGAKTMCEYTKEEFVSGMIKMGVDSVDKLKKKFPDLRPELRNDEKFKDIYLYAFSFSCEKGQKCVQLEVACGMWRLLLSGYRKWDLVEEWCTFLGENYANRAISKDTWSQLFDFIQTIKPDFSNFDESAAWPVMLDGFVEWMKEKKGGS